MLCLKLCSNIFAKSFPTIKKKKKHKQTLKWSFIHFGFFLLGGSFTLVSTLRILCYSSVLFLFILITDVYILCNQILFVIDRVSSMIICLWEQLVWILLQTLIKMWEFTTGISCSPRRTLIHVSKTFKNTEMFRISSIYSL